MRKIFNDSLGISLRGLSFSRIMEAGMTGSESIDQKPAVKNERRAWRWPSLWRVLPLLAFLVIALVDAAPAQAQIFDGPGGSGSGWVQMFRGNGMGPIADPGSSQNFAGALRIAVGVYSNALLIVASIILLYHLLIMTTETAHQGVVGGKRTNQIWAPIRLVIAIGLLVPLASGLNSAQYITLQVIEWGSNMATRVWSTFLEHSGDGAGTDPTPHMPDVGAIAREAAKIGSCMALVNNYVQRAGGNSKEMVTRRGYGPAVLYGTEKFESLCGSVIIFAGGIGAAAGMAGIEDIISQMEQYAPYFMQGNTQFNGDPGPAPVMSIAMMLGALESVSGGWSNNAVASSAGSGWVSAGAYFLKLAAGGSNRVSGTDTLPIIMGPQAERIRPQAVQTAFYRMAEWIVGRYKSHISGGGADSDMLGNTVAGRKFVDLLLLFMDQMGFVSGLWGPGTIAFSINLGNSPLAEMVDIGHRMIRTALDFMGAAVELGVNAPQHAMYSALAASSKDEKAFGPKSGQFFATMAIPVLTAFASTLMSMGIWIGIFTPLLPFLKFVLSVMTWLASVVETLVCVPLMALAYLTPYGEGFGGQKVESSYYLVMHAFLRPVMTVFGLIAAILLFNIAAHLVTTFYQTITATSGTFKGGMYVVAKIAFGMMYLSMLYVCLNSALKVMDTFGRHATRWMGGQSHEENMGDPQQAIQMAKEGTAMFGQMAGQIGYSAKEAGQMLSGGMKGAAGGGGGGGGADPNNPNHGARMGGGSSGGGRALTQQSSGGSDSDTGGGAQPQQRSTTTADDASTSEQFSRSTAAATQQQTGAPTAANNDMVNKVTDAGNLNAADRQFLSNHFRSDQAGGAGGSEAERIGRATDALQQDRAARNRTIDT
jgi:hypothetical protein